MANRYFKCKQNHGVFAPIEKVKLARATNRHLAAQELEKLDIYSYKFIPIKDEEFIASSYELVDNTNLNAIYSDCFQNVHLIDKQGKDILTNTHRPESAFTKPEHSNKSLLNKTFELDADRTRMISNRIPTVDSKLNTDGNRLKMVNTLVAGGPNTVNHNLNILNSKSTSSNCSTASTSSSTNSSTSSVSNALQQQQQQQLQRNKLSFQLKMSKFNANSTLVGATTATITSPPSKLIKPIATADKIKPIETIVPKNDEALNQENHLIGKFIFFIK